MIAVSPAPRVATRSRQAPKRPKKLQPTPEQQEAIDTLLKLFLDGDEPAVMALHGPAGAGKSTTIGFILRAFYKAGRLVQMVAPTHKARKILLLDKRPPGFPSPITVSKLVGAKAGRHKDDVTFDSGSADHVCRYARQCFPPIRGARHQPIHLIVVDESSMVTAAHAHHIVKGAAEARCSVLFVGDPYQLPPPDNSKPAEDSIDDPDEDTRPGQMSSWFLRKDGLGLVQIETVMRHAGPILWFATKIRLNFTACHAQGIYDLPPVDPGHDPRAVTQAGDNWMGQLLNETGKLAFHAAQCLDDPAAAAKLFKTCPRVLSFTNNEARRVGDAVRVNLYGSSALSKWQRGEIIMVGKFAPPCNCSLVLDYCERHDLMDWFSMADGCKVIHSCTDAIILDAEDAVWSADHIFHYETDKRREKKQFSVNMGGEFQILRLQLLEPDGTPSTGPWAQPVIMTPRISNSETWEQYVAVRAKVNRHYGPKDPQWEWMGKVRTLFPSLFSAFCMTIHKSQGSGFETVYVNNDLQRPDDIETQNRLLYVAATRARTRLVLR